MRFALLVVVWFGCVAASAQHRSGQAASQDRSFDAVLEQVEAAQVQLVNGRPDAFKALWLHDDEVTLSGGLGGVIVKSWRQVSERLDWVATQYRDGTRTHEEVARYVGPDLAYVVPRETIRFRSPMDAKHVPVWQHLQLCVEPSKDRVRQQQAGGPGRLTRDRLGSGQHELRRRGRAWRRLGLLQLPSTRLLPA